MSSVTHRSRRAESRVGQDAGEVGRQLGLISVVSSRVADVDLQGQVLPVVAQVKHGRLSLTARDTRHDNLASVG